MFILYLCMTLNKILKVRIVRSLFLLHFILETIFFFVLASTSSTTKTTTTQLSHTVPMLNHESRREKKIHIIQKPDCYYMLLFQSYNIHILFICCSDSILYFFISSRYSRHWFCRECYVFSAKMIELGKNGGLLALFIISNFWITGAPWKVWPFQFQFKIYWYKKH